MPLLGPQYVVSRETHEFPQRQCLSQYYGNIAKTKSHLRILIYTHILLVFLVLCQILTYHTFSQATWNVPRPHLWQYIWLMSALASTCGLISMKNNLTFLMNIFFYGTLIFGLGTIMITIILNLSELFTFKKLKTSHHLDEIEAQTLFGFPLLVLWYIFLVITVQIHVFSLYMANIVLCNWQQYKSAKHN